MMLQKDLNKECLENWELECKTIATKLSHLTLLSIVAYQNLDGRMQQNFCQIDRAYLSILLLYTYICLHLPLTIDTS